jgi:twitching motility two-component system response regulator PilH
MRQGARDYIVKPPNEDALIARIEQLLGNGT